MLSYDLDEYEIQDLKNIQFREEVEEISLWGNQIFNPEDITKNLMTLPNLKALWLNDNPVVTNCQNFNVIGNVFDKLEIFNSALTAKAGEWAMLFYARDSGAKRLEDIVSLELQGKNLLMVKDLSFLNLLLIVGESIADLITIMILVIVQKKSFKSGSRKIPFLFLKKNYLMTIY